MKNGGQLHLLIPHGTKDAPISSGSQRVFNIFLWKSLFSEWVNHSPSSRFFSLIFTMKFPPQGCWSMMLVSQVLRKKSMVFFVRNMNSIPCTPHVSSEYPHKFIAIFHHDSLLLNVFESHENTKIIFLKNPI